ncbi:DUF937 domain-containing protein [Paludisphaera mucosa]|uniref:DUF937 domain-containing protein n=1 Tax=Paludisphaera mucosa TaxID=3030827 RepID=A0ABT6F4L3_9BACT|nr:DUF937 domain-containing protein [Paludisphaera mucosa]MDG3002528.1 DUF937 domain-containing protein [Paludisphaera mucosa]
MAVDLLSLVKSIFDVEAVHKLSVALDEQPDRVEQALALGGPAILAGLLDAAAAPRDADRLLDEIRQAPPRPHPAGGPSDAAHDVGAILRSGSLDSIASNGRSMLRTIFGDRLGGVMDLVADGSGARPATVATILAMLAPAFAGLIRVTLGPPGITLDGLRGLLSAQRDAIVRQAPGGLAEALGLHGLAELGAAHAVAPPRPGQTTDWSAPQSADLGPISSMVRWAIPTALGVLALLAAYELVPRGLPRNAPNDRLEAPDADRPATDLAQAADEEPPPAALATAEGRPALETAARGVSLALPGDVTIEVPENSYVEAMVKALRTGGPALPQTFLAPDLTLDRDGKLTREGTDAIARLARIAGAYPGVKFRIQAREALKDVDPAASRATAGRIAEAVRAALVAAGVSADRIGAEAAAADLADDVPIAIAIVAE